MTKAIDAGYTGFRGVAVRDRGAPTSASKNTRQAEEPVSTLRVERTTVNDLVVLQLRGDVDLSNVAHVECALRETCDAMPDAGRLLVDATAVDFLSVAGVTALVRGQRRCQERGLGFSVVAAHRAVLRPLQATGVCEKVTIFPSLEVAAEKSSVEPVAD
jgi:anti-anti-sigma factor